MTCQGHRAGKGEKEAGRGFKTAVCLGRSREVGEQTNRDVAEGKARAARELYLSMATQVWSAFSG